MDQERAAGRSRVVQQGTCAAVLSGMCSTPNLLIKRRLRYEQLQSFMGVYGTLKEVIGLYGMLWFHHIFHHTPRGRSPPQEVLLPLQVHHPDVAFVNSYREKQITRSGCKRLFFIDLFGPTTISTQHLTRRAALSGSGNCHFDTAQSRQQMPHVRTISMVLTPKYPLARPAISCQHSS